jgi:phage terminase large subunit-like protein
MNPRKTINELKASGTWVAMSKAEQAERLAAEAPQVFAFGIPPVPPNLTAKVKEQFVELCSQLQEKRLIAKTDGPFLVDYIEARLAGDRAAMHSISAEWLGGRKPFELELDAPVESEVLEAKPPEALPAARKYAEELISGVIPAGRFAILAAKRFLDDLEHGAERGLSFDEVAAQHAVTYITRLGLELLGWETFILSQIFGWKRTDGTRRFREAFIEIGKKNGKSALAGAICLFMADTEQGDHEPHAAVFIGATCKAQSEQVCFLAVKRLRLETPSLAERCRQYRSSILFEGSGSSIEPLASDSTKLQGKNISAGILDELGDFESAALYSTFTSSTVGRTQPLIVSITTAGKAQQGIAWDRRSHGIQILEGAPGDYFFAFICELDEGENWEDPKCWIKANPSLGSHFLKADGIGEQLQNAKGSSSLQYDALRYHLNIWPSTNAAPWVDVSLLDQMGNAYRNDVDKALSVPKRIAAALAHRLEKKQVDLSKLSMSELLKLQSEQSVSRPYAGGDFAEKSDLSVLCISYPPAKPDGLYEVFFKVWIPAENIRERSQQHKVGYETWRDQGLVTVTNGDTTDFEQLQNDILELHRIHGFRELGVDRAKIPDMIQRLEKSGIKITSVQQGFRLSPGIRRVEKLIQEHRFCTFGNPIFRWCAQNVLLKIGSINGDAQFYREKVRDKIDCAVAASIAVMIEMSQSQQAIDPSGARLKVRTIEMP